MGQARERIALYSPSVPLSRGPKCIDLFSGAGGLAVGFREAGWAILAANDADGNAGRTFRLNFPESFFFEGPIASLTPGYLMSKCGIVPGELDAIIGGPPCQSFSYNNHQRSADDERARLFSDYLRLVAKLRPKSLVMENVPGMLTVGDGDIIDEIRAKLRAMKYECEDKILSSEEFGTPQIRKRVFIVASRIGCPLDMLPRATHRSAKSDSQATAKLPRPITVQQAIGDLPEIENGEKGQQATYEGRRATTKFQKSMRTGSRKLYNHACHDLSTINLKRMQHIPEGGNWRDIPRRLLTNGMKRADLAAHTKRYGRLSRTAQASTILTSCSPHWGAYIHPTQDRTISIREAARLQGFPDRFRLAGQSRGQQYKQVGNAVPVPVAQAIGVSVARHIAKSKRKAS